MGYLTQEIGNSPALSPLYPSFYKESQINNQMPVDVVVTDHTGKQVVLPKWPKATTKSDLEITVREFNGLRIKETKHGMEQVPIPAKRYIIKYEEILLYPVRLDELGIIVSTEEHSLIAKNLMLESEYNPDISESLSDFDESNPRFVFEVMDPFNRWENLYLNVLGQTITLRCGHASEIIADIDENTLNEYNDRCSLSCYLRYPSNYAQDDRATVPVFTICLKDLDLEEPYVLPSGDVVCIASSKESLERVMLKKHTGRTTDVNITGMISKDVHDQMVSNLKQQVEDDKKAAAAQIRAVRVKADADIAEIKSKLDAEKRKNEQLNQQISYWDSIHKADTDRRSREDKLILDREKMRTELQESSRKDMDASWTMLKIAGTAAAGLLSFAIAVMAKSNK